MVKLLKRRYVLFHLETESPPTRRDMKQVLEEGQNVMTNEQRNRWNVRLLQYDRKSKLGVVRCDHRNLPVVRKFLYSLDDSKLSLKTLRTSGTLKSLRDAFPALR